MVRPQFARRYFYRRGPFNMSSIQTPVASRVQYESRSLKMRTASWQRENSHRMRLKSISRPWKARQRPCDDGAMNCSQGKPQQVYPNRRLLLSQVLREMLAGSWLYADPQARFRLSLIRRVERRRLRRGCHAHA